MAINNTVELIGNMNKKAVRIIETEESTFAGFSLATTDSYKDDKGEWHDKETLWHNCIAFNPTVIEVLKGLNTKARIKITGTLSYRPFEVQTGEGEIITKKEASIIVRKVEQAPLTKKKKDS